MHLVPNALPHVRPGPTSSPSLGGRCSAADEVAHGVRTRAQGAQAKHGGTSELRGGEPVANDLGHSLPDAACSASATRKHYFLQLARLGVPQAGRFEGLNVFEDAGRKAARLKVRRRGPGRLHRRDQGLDGERSQLDEGLVSAPS